MGAEMNIGVLASIQEQKDAERTRALKSKCIQVFRWSNFFSQPLTSFQTPTNIFSISALDCVHLRHVRALAGLKLSFPLAL